MELHVEYSILSEDGLTSSKWGSLTLPDGILALVFQGEPFKLIVKDEELLVKSVGTPPTAKGPRLTVRPVGDGTRTTAKLYLKLVKP